VTELVNAKCTLNCVQFSSDEALGFIQYKIKHRELKGTDCSSLIHTWAGGRGLLSLGGGADAGNLGSRVAAPRAQPLSQRRLFHLFSHKIVPAITTLPHQPHLVAEDGQVAHEANGCHGSAINTTAPQGEWGRVHCLIFYTNFTWH